MPDLRSMLAKGYSAKVLRRGNYQTVVQEIRAALQEDSALAAEAMKRRAELQDFSNRVGSLRDRDFASHVHLQTLIDAIGGGL